jgi:hypothetical protein
MSKRIKLLGLALVLFVLAGVFSELILLGRRSGFPDNFTSAVSAQDLSSGAQLSGSGRSVICPGKAAELHWQIIQSGFTKATIGVLVGTSANPGAWKAITLYTLDGSTPTCARAGVANTSTYGCVPVMPSQTTLYTLTIEGQAGLIWYSTQYQTVVEVIRNGDRVYLDAHNDGNTATWLAEVKDVDPDLFVRQVRLQASPPHTSALSAPASDGWDLTNLNRPDAITRLIGNAASSAHFPLHGRFALNPIDLTTNPVLPPTSRNRNMTLSLELSLACTVTF